MFYTSKEQGGDPADLEMACTICTSPSSWCLTRLPAGANTSGPHASGRLGGRGQLVEPVHFLGLPMLPQVGGGRGSSAMIGIFFAGPDVIRRGCSVSSWHRRHCGTATVSLPWHTTRNEKDHWVWTHSPIFRKTQRQAERSGRINFS